MSNDSLRWYPSKVDLWLGIILVMLPVVCIVSVCFEVMRGNSSGAWIGLSSSALVALIYAGLIFPMRYAITDKDIIVRHGFVKQRIPLSNIQEVYPTRSPLSSPALSLDRIFIRFGEGYFNSAMISPVNKDVFLDELMTKAKLRREGERLKAERIS